MDDQNQVAQQSCMTCGGLAVGYKCDMCGNESSMHDANHQPCGGDHCLPKCLNCNEAESKCTCHKDPSDTKAQ